MFYNDDDAESGQQRWMESEILRRFAQKYFKETEETIQPSNQAELENLAQLAEDDRIYKLAQQKSEYIEEINATIDSLNKLATASNHNNEKASYLIERSTNEIRAILEEANDQFGE